MTDSTELPSRMPLTGSCMIFCDAKTYIFGPVSQTYSGYVAQYGNKALYSERHDTPLAIACMNMSSGELARRW